jgi:hypothetical protein
MISSLPPFNMIDCLTVTKLIFKGIIFLEIDKKIKEMVLL